MTNEHGIEFAQTYELGGGKNGGGDDYFLYSGNRNSVSLPVNRNTMLVNHTHPESTLKPSEHDINYLLEATKAGSPQKSSVILPANGSGPVRFNANTEAAKPKMNYLNPENK